MALYLLMESAAGYALFERVESEEIGMQLPRVQEVVTDLARFSKVIKLKAFIPFPSAEAALENINSVSEGCKCFSEENKLDFSGEVTVLLKDFLEMNLPKVKEGKRSKFTLGVCEPKVGNIIQETMNISCQSNDLVLELLR